MLNCSLFVNEIITVSVWLLLTFRSVLLPCQRLNQVLMLLRWKQRLLSKAVTMFSMVLRCG